MQKQFSVNQLILLVIYFTILREEKKREYNYKLQKFKTNFLLPISNLKILKLSCSEEG